MSWYCDCALCWVLCCFLPVDSVTKLTNNGSTVSIAAGYGLPMCSTNYRHYNTNGNNSRSYNTGGNYPWGYNTRGYNTRGHNTRGYNTREIKSMLSFLWVKDINSDKLLISEESTTSSWVLCIAAFNSPCSMSAVSRTRRAISCGWRDWGK